MSSCSSKDKPRRNTAMIVPTSESKLVKIYSYKMDNGFAKTIITSKGNIVYRNSKEVYLDKLRILHIIEENSKYKYIELSADKGKVNYKTLDCEAWSNAVIIRDKEVRIESERIFWSEGKKQFYTQGEEKVTLYKVLNPDDPEDNSMIRTIGTNLLADQGLKTIELEEGTTATPYKAIEDKY